jgi:hypothetical protein
MFYGKCILTIGNIHTLNILHPILIVIGSYPETFDI